MKNEKEKESSPKRIFLLELELLQEAIAQTIIVMENYCCYCNLMIFGQQPTFEETLDIW
jgi:hypothetical protein